MLLRKATCLHTSFQFWIAKDFLSQKNASIVRITPASFTKRMWCKPEQVVVFLWVALLSRFALLASNGPQGFSFPATSAWGRLCNKRPRGFFWQIRNCSLLHVIREPQKYTDRFQKGWLQGANYNSYKFYWNEIQKVLFVQLCFIWTQLQVIQQCSCCF